MKITCPEDLSEFQTMVNRMITGTEQMCSIFGTNAYQEFRMKILHALRQSTTFPDEVTVFPGTGYMLRISCTMLLHLYIILPTADTVPAVPTRSSVQCSNASCSISCSSVPPIAICDSQGSETTVTPMEIEYTPSCPKKQKTVY